MFIQNVNTHPSAWLSLKM